MSLALLVGPDRKFLEPKRWFLMNLGYVSSKDNQNYLCGNIDESAFESAKLYLCQKADSLLLRKQLNFGYRLGIKPYYQLINPCPQSFPSSKIVRSVHYGLQVMQTVGSCKKPTKHPSTNKAKYIFIQVLMIETLQLNYSYFINLLLPKT